MLASLLLAFLTALWLTRHLTNPDSVLAVLDHPNERSLHARPVPRTGGLGILAGGLLGLSFLALVGLPLPPLAGLLVAALVLAAVSYLDDHYSLPVGLRFAVHLLAAALVLTEGLAPTAVGLPGVIWPLGHGLGVPAAMLFLVWMTNLYNFMDGMDGFSGGMAVAGFGTFSVFGILGGDPGFAAVTGLIAASSLGFLWFNFPPARVFMGDVGAPVLGLVAGGLMLYADRSHLFPLWIGVVVFSPFIVDATVTLLRRLVRREPVWRAHRGHYYQRLVQLGWGHRRTVLWEYGVMGTMVAGGLVAYHGGPAIQWLVIVGVGALYGGLGWAIHRLEAVGGRRRP